MNKQTDRQTDGLTLTTEVWCSPGDVYALTRALSGQHLHVFTHNVLTLVICLSLTVGVHTRLEDTVYLHLENN